MPWFNQLSLVWPPSKRLRAALKKLGPSTRESLHHIHGAMRLGQRVWGQLAAWRLQGSSKKRNKHMKRSSRQDNARRGKERHTSGGSCCRAIRKLIHSPNSSQHSRTFRHRSTWPRHPKDKGKLLISHLFPLQTVGEMDTALVLDRFMTIHKNGLSSKESCPAGVGMKVSPGKAADGCMDGRGVAKAHSCMVHEAVC